MAIEQELTYLYDLTRFGIQPGLAVMEQMMELLGHPEKQCKSIHVTGTNGKGSTCAMIESVLRTSGYKTALYTSPHIYSFNERIRVNGISISDAELAALVAEIRTIVEAAHIQPTFFEFTTALAYLYFSRSKIDIAVVEVGMGGRYDATNVITPILSVITNVGLDHMDYIGPTKGHIAREKAGIIKEGVPVLTAEKDSDILRIFDLEASEKNTRVIRVNEIISVNVVSVDLNGQEIDVGGNRIHLPLLGAHQVENLKTSLGALRMIASSFPVSSEEIVEGIAHTSWEGRMQVVSQNPLIIVDGAHNQDGALALAAFLETIPRKETLLFAAKKDKDISDMLANVIPLFSHIVITEGSYMPESAEMLAEKIRVVHPSVRIEKNVGKAIELAKATATLDGTIVITGSLYMVADALVYFKNL